MRKVGRPKGMTFSIKLTPKQREEFKASQKRGKHSARVLTRMRVVLYSDEGKSNKEISEKEEICEHTVYNTLKKFAETNSVEDRPRKGRPEKLSGEVKAHIIATACTDAPEGRAKWTLRLLAENTIQMELVDSISKNTVGRVLKKTNLSPGDKKAGV